MWCRPTALSKAEIAICRPCSVLWQLTVRNLIRTLRRDAPSWRLHRPSSSSIERWMSTRNRTSRKAQSRDRAIPSSADRMTLTAAAAPSTWTGPGWRIGCVNGISRRHVIHAASVAVTSQRGVLRRATRRDGGKILPRGASTVRYRQTMPRTIAVTNTNDMRAASMCMRILRSIVHSFGRRGKPASAGGYAGSTRSFAPEA